MKGMPHYRQYPMGDVVNANLEPGEYVVRRNAVNSIGKDNMELLNQADGAHGALNKLMVSASLVNLQPQDNSPVKIEANGFPIADSPVRQRVDATRNMQKGGSVDLKRKTDETWSEAYSKYDILGEDDNYQRIYKSSLLGKVPAEIVGGEGGDRYYLGEGTSKAKSLAFRKARAMMDQKISHSPSDSIPAAMVGDYFPEYMQEEAPMEEAPVEAPKKKGRLRGLLGFQEGGEVDFKEHMMYDKNDKGYLAKTYEDHLRMKKMGYSHKGMQEGGEVGKYEKALQKAEMMGDAGYALPESLSAPAEEMSNMRPAEDLYGMYMRMGPQMVKDKMSGMESRALDSLLQQKMNNMDRPAVPQYGMGGMIDEYNMGGYVKKYQDGGEVEEDINPKQLQAMAMLDSLRQEGGEKLESLPSDNYSGQQVPKNAMTIMPYLKSFGRMRTPLQEQERFMFQRYGLNPDALPPQLQGLRGLALRQRMGNEEI